MTSSAIKIRHFSRWFGAGLFGSGLFRSELLRAGLLASWLLCLSLLPACGGGSGSGGGASSQTSSAALSSMPASSLETSSSSNSSAVSLSSSSQFSIPADFPVGTAEALPVLSIATTGAAPIVSKENYLTGNYSLTVEGQNTLEGALEIRGRGNSTWAWVKKPYRLKLGAASEILGMPSNRHWVLLANYADKTLIRNDMAFRFGRSLGMEYSPRNQHVELQLNGAYQGVYQLTEHIRIGKDRVNIPELKVGDTDAEKITGGYLLEVDFRMDKDYCKGPAANWESFCVGGVNLEREATFCVDSSQAMPPFCVDTPETLLEPAWAAQRDYIQSYINTTEAVLFGAGFTHPETGYAAYIDVDSAIHYFLVNELFKNPDGAVASFYLYKKRNGKLFFGPLWDFDLAMGNAGYNGMDIATGWYIRNAPWFNRLFQDPAFVAKVKARWQALKTEGKLEEIFHYARARATWLDKQQAKNYSIWDINDFDSWIMHGTHGGTGSYAAEVDELIRWQRERYNWIDSQLAD